MYAKFRGRPLLSIRGGVGFVWEKDKTQTTQIIAEAATAIADQALAKPVACF
jgi:hypothetical protein